MVMVAAMVVGTTGPGTTCKNMRKKPKQAIPILTLLIAGVLLPPASTMLHSVLSKLTPQLTTFRLVRPTLKSCQQSTLNQYLLLLMPPNLFSNSTLQESLLMQLPAEPQLTTPSSLLVMELTQLAETTSWSETHGAPAGAIKASL
jgi:hypothetical protein